MTIRVLIARQRASQCRWLDTHQFKASQITPGRKWHCRCTHARDACAEAWAVEIQLLMLMVHSVQNEGCLAVYLRRISTPDSRSTQATLAWY